MPQNESSNSTMIWSWWWKLILNGLILTKSELNVEWFVFGCILIKMILW